MSNLSKQNSDGTIRNPGIELLKIIAIILIVISHIVQTLHSDLSQFISYSDYVVDLSVATTNIKYFILICFRHFGILGNSIFFISSAWFLLESSKYNKRKWFFMLAEVWVISIFILATTFILRGGDISGKLIIKSIFPTIFANNWYMTCYLLFYPLHPLLNSIINNMTKKNLFRFSTAMAIIYICFGFLKSGLFFSSAILLWITIYFVIAYLKRHLVNFMDNVKYNIILFIFGVVGFIFLVFVTNILGLQINYFNDKLLHWNSNCNLFLIIVAIAMFNLMRNFNFRNKAVNYISSLSLLIYLIHENIILRTYYRPAMWNYVYQNYGYSNILIWVCLLAIIVFLLSLICSIVYDKIFRNLVLKTSNAIFEFIKKQYLRIENRFLD